MTPAGVVTTLNTTAIARPYGLAVDSSGNLYVASGNSTIYEVAPSGAVSTFINGGAGLNGPTGLAFDGCGNLYVANYANDDTTPGLGFISEYSSTGQLINASVASSFSDPEFLAIAVPEPTSMTLLLLAGVPLLGRRRRAA